MVESTVDAIQLLTVKAVSYMLATVSAFRAVETTNEFTTIIGTLV